MKLNIADKIIIGIVGILLIFAGISIYKRGFSGNKQKNILLSDSISYTEPLPDNIQKLSKKFGVYPELYNSDSKVVVYGYNQFSTDSKFNKTFHKKLEKELNSNNYSKNYKIIVYKNWEDRYDEIMAANFPDNRMDVCTPETGDEKIIENMILFSQTCIKKVCIIDINNNSATVMDRDINLITKTLKEYKSGAN